MKKLSLLAVIATVATPVLADRDHNVQFSNDVVSVADFASTEIAAKDGYINDINGTVRR